VDTTGCRAHSCSSLAIQIRGSSGADRGPRVLEAAVAVAKVKPPPRIGWASRPHSARFAADTRSRHWTGPPSAVKALFNRVQRHFTNWRTVPLEARIAGRRSHRRLFDSATSEEKDALNRHQCSARLLPEC